MSLNPALQQLVHQKRQAAEDDMVGWELLSLALANTPVERLNQAGLHSDLLTTPGVGLPTDFVRIEFPFTRNFKQ